MGWVYLIIFIIIQVAVAAVVVVVLKKKLEKELVEAAIEKLFALNGSDAQGVATVTSFNELQGPWREAIETLLKRKFPAANIVINRDEGLKGGLVINVLGQTLDFSLAHRLKNFWI